MNLMRRMIAILLLGTCFAAVASADAAQPRGRQNRPPRARLSPEATFLARDLDADDQLSFDEFTFPAEGQPWFDDAQRNFHVYDADEDGFLTLDEFKQTPGATPPRVPGKVADPILRELEAAAASADNDQTRSALEVAWGLRRPSGEPLRTDTGLVYRDRVFRTRDADGDGRLTADEFPAPNQDPQAAAQQFERADRDGDARLTFSEFSSAPSGRMNVAQAFKRFDENADGRLDRDEFLAAVPRWESDLAEKSFSIFDANADGLLSFQEFRATPFANPIGNAMHRLKDSDDDGRLSPSEFRDLWNPEAPALAAWYFSRFDADGDGRLTLHEFPFAVNVSAVPRDAAFLAKDTDGDGRLSLAEFHGRQPPEGDPTALARYEQQLARFEDNLLAADRDRDGALSLEEFRTARLTPQADASVPDELSADADFAAGAPSPGSADSPHEPPGDAGLEWWLIAILVVDALVVVWLVWLFVNRRRSRQHAGTTTSSQPLPPA